MFFSGFGGDIINAPKVNYNKMTIASNIYCITGHKLLWFNIVGTITFYYIDNIGFMFRNGHSFEFALQLYCAS